MGLLQQWGGSSRVSLGCCNLIRKHQAKESGGKLSIWNKGPWLFGSSFCFTVGSYLSSSEMVAGDSAYDLMRLPQLRCQNPSFKISWKKAGLRSPTQWGWIQLAGGMSESKWLSVRSFHPHIQPCFCRWGTRIGLKKQAGTCMGGGNSNLLAANAGLWGGLFLGLSFSVMWY